MLRYVFKVSYLDRLAVCRLVCDRCEVAVHFFLFLSLLLFFQRFKDGIKPICAGLSIRHGVALLVSLPRGLSQLLLGGLTVRDTAIGLREFGQLIDNQLKLHFLHLLSPAKCGSITVDATGRTRPHNLSDLLDWLNWAPLTDLLATSCFKL